MGLQAAKATQIELSGVTTRTCTDLAYNECCATETGENFNTATFTGLQGGDCVKVFRFQGLRDSCEGALSRQQWSMNGQQITLHATSISGARVERVPQGALCPTIPVRLEDAQRVMEMPVF